MLFFTQNSLGEIHLKLIRTDYPQSWKPRAPLWDAFFDLHGGPKLRSSDHPIGGNVQIFQKICTRPGHSEEYTLSVDGTTVPLPGEEPVKIETSLKVKSDHVTGVPVSVPGTLKNMVPYMPVVEPRVSPLDYLEAINPFTHIKNMFA